MFGDSKPFSVRNLSSAASFRSKVKSDREELASYANLYCNSYGVDFAYSYPSMEGTYALSDSGEDFQISDKPIPTVSMTSLDGTEVEVRMVHDDINELLMNPLSMPAAVPVAPNMSLPIEDLLHDAWMETVNAVDETMGRDLTCEVTAHSSMPTGEVRGVLNASNNLYHVEGENLLADSAEHAGRNADVVYAHFEKYIEALQTLRPQIERGLLHAAVSSSSEGDELQRRLIQLGSSHLE
jgi:hypothetical protein